MKRRGRLTSAGHMILVAGTWLCCNRDRKSRKGLDSSVDSKVKSYELGQGVPNLEEK